MKLGKEGAWKPFRKVKGGLQRRGEERRIEDANTRVNREADKQHRQIRSQAGHARRRTECVGG